MSPTPEVGSHADWTRYTGLIGPMLRAQFPQEEGQSAGSGIGGFWGGAPGEFEVISGPLQYLEPTDAKILMAAEGEWEVEDATDRVSWRWDGAAVQINVPFDSTGKIFLVWLIS